jgi:hypothetical protein
MAAFGLRNQAIWTIARLSLTSIHAALSSALIPWRQGFFPAPLYLCGYGLVLGSIGIVLQASLPRSMRRCCPLPWPLNPACFPAH